MMHGEMNTDAVVGEFSLRDHRGARREELSRDEADVQEV